MDSHIEGSVDRQSDVAGRVTIEKGTQIVNSKIRGPVIIGKECIIENSYIGPFTSIGDRSEIHSSEVEYSIILRDCRINRVGIRIEGSILGNDVEVVEANGKPRVHRFMIGDQSRIEVA
jgi:glucose-1-phosphate thymidylyltransferase